MKLALGTVQFGLAYGALNDTGRAVDEAEVAAILDMAARIGVDRLDTARAYGASEAVLGRLGAARRFGIVSKIAPLAGAGGDGVRRSVETSLAALGAERLAGLMLHRAEDLCDETWRALEQAPADRVGLSVYTPAEALLALDRYPVRLLQVPMNVLDRRFAEAGVLDRARTVGCEVHARSVFLQGTLLAEPATLPKRLHRLASILATLPASGADARMAQALAPVLDDARVDRMVVGVDSAAQLEAIVGGCLRGADRSDAIVPPQTDDETLLDPRYWPEA